MTIEAFMNQIDEVKRIQTLRNQIGEIQKELGFDDVVAEYLLEHPEYLNNESAEVVLDEIENENGFDIDDLNQGGPNLCEILLIQKFPIAAFKIYKNKDKAENMTKSKFGYNGLNDCSDAFRHAYFNILNAKSVGIPLAKLFGTAHECGVPSSQQIESVMDLHNNKMGIKLFSLLPGKSDTYLASQLLLYVDQGVLRFLEPTLTPQQDQNFWLPKPGTHGITSSTQVVPTNPNCH